MKSLGCGQLHSYCTVWISEHQRSSFFPLFSLLIAGGARLLGGGSWSYILVGTLISNGALLGALLIIYHLAVDLVGEELSQRTLLYLCIFPTAFFLLRLITNLFYCSLQLETFSRYAARNGGLLAYWACWPHLHVWLVF